MTQTILVRGAKHGVGTTVIACALAQLHAVRAPTVLFDYPGIDVHVVMGLGPPPPFDWTDPQGTEARPSLVVIGTDDCDELPPLEVCLRRIRGKHQGAVIVVDCGTERFSLAGAQQILVIDNTYLTLRRAIRALQNDDTVVLRYNTDFALDGTDVERALGKPVLRVTDSAEVQRAVDAGLFVVRTPRALQLALEELDSGVER